MGDTAAGLLPNFIRRAAIVRQPIRRIAVLIGIKIFRRLGSGQFTNASNGAVSSFVTGSHHQFRAIRVQNALAFVGGAARQK